MADAWRSVLIAKVRSFSRTKFSKWWQRNWREVALAALFIYSSYGFYSIKHERDQRVNTVAGVISLFCDVNNQQDEYLAGLVAVSVRQGTFGEVDHALLSNFAIRVIHAINQIQDASQSPTQQQDLETIFEATLTNLQNETPCDQIVIRYRAGEPIPTLEQLDAAAQQTMTTTTSTTPTTQSQGGSK